MDNQFSRETVAVFHTADALQAAIDELLSSGFNRAEISLLAGEKAVDEQLGHIYKRASEAEDDPDAPRTAYIAPETFGDAEGAVLGALIYVPALIATGAVVASGGTIAAAAVAAAIGGGGGGIVGGILAAMIGEHHAKAVHDQLEKGGLLLWVQTPDEEREKLAVDILSRHSGDDVHVHGIRTS